MTVQVIQMFPPTILNTGSVTLYSVPALPTQIVLGRARMRFTNTDTIQHVVTAYDIPVGGTAAVGNDFCPGLAVPPGSNLDIDVPVLAAGGFIQAKADAGTVVVAHALDGILFS